MADGLRVNFPSLWEGWNQFINKFEKLGWATGIYISWHRPLRRTLVLNIFMATINEQTIRK